MGAACAQSTPQVVKSKQIDKQLIREKHSRTIKLLLLGTSECGKSTILKQMRILHGTGFSDHECRATRFIVYMNVVQSMHALIRAMESFGYEFSDTACTNHASIVSAVIEEEKEYAPFSQSLERSLKALWADESIQLCFFERKPAIHIADSAKYFLDDIGRIGQPNYVPNQQDMLYLRNPTCGVAEVTFNIKNTLFRVVDVGGQRSQRSKWMHVFDDVNSIIFLTAISEFDQLLEEDEETNRMTESLGLFDEICNSDNFSARVSMILFLNKTDLFEQKLEKKSIKVAFPEYTGSQDYQESVKYVEKEFLKLKKNPEKKIYPHQTCATNTNQVQIVLNSVIDTIHMLNSQTAAFV